MFYPHWLQNFQNYWLQGLKDNAAHRDKDIETLKKFIHVYCRHHHGRAKKAPLCSPCQDLLDYAMKRREKCPYDPKPACKNCATHCYHPAYRQQIREIMKFSGMHFVKRGRVDWLIRYFLQK